MPGAAEPGKAALERPNHGLPMSCHGPERAIPRGWLWFSATLAVWMDGATAGAGRGNRGGDFLEVFRSKAERSRIEPSVYLRRAAGTDDGGGDSGPCQCPCERDARHAGIVSRRDRPHRIDDFQIADEDVAREIGRARTPVVLGQRSRVVSMRVLQHIQG